MNQPMPQTAMQHYQHPGMSTPPTASTTTPSSSNANAGATCDNEVAVESSLSFWSGSSSSSSSATSSTSAPAAPATSAPPSRLPFPLGSGTATTTPMTAGTNRRPAVVRANSGRLRLGGGLHAMGGALMVSDSDYGTATATAPADPASSHDKLREDEMAFVASSSSSSAATSSSSAGAAAPSLTPIVLPPFLRTMSPTTAPSSSSTRGDAAATSSASPADAPPFSAQQRRLQWEEEQRPQKQQRQQQQGPAAKKQKIHNHPPPPPPMLPAVAMTAPPVAAAIAARQRPHQTVRGEGMGLCSGKEEESSSPQYHLDRLLRKRGYSTRTHCSLDGGYYNKPTTLQKSSYGLRVVQAIRSSDAGLLRRLLRCGLSRNPCNAFGESALHMACRRGDADLLRVFLDEGGTVQVSDDFGRTPLHDACWTSTPNFDCVDSLLRRDVRLLHVTDCRGACPLSYVRKENWHSWIEYFDRRSDEFWPSRQQRPKDDGNDGEGQSAPPLSKLPPHSRSLPDPEGCLTPDLAELVASGRMEPEDTAAAVAAKSEESTGSSAMGSNGIARHAAGIFPPSVATTPPVPTTG